MNIDGLSEATLEKFIGHGLIGRFGDIFELEKYRDEIVQMEGFGMPIASLAFSIQETKASAFFSRVSPYSVSLATSLNLANFFSAFLP